MLSGDAILHAVRKHALPWPGENNIIIIRSHGVMDKAVALC